MKSVVRTFTLLAVTVLFAAAGNAQFSSMTLKFNTPFEFNVGNRTYPAGDYFLVRAGLTTLALRDGDYKFLTLVGTGSTESLNPHAVPTIRFIGERHALAEVWKAGTTTGYKLYVPRESETEVARAQAGKQVAIETTTMSHTK
jgi:hypothetical protein